jgi:hypothetical protein
LEREIIKPFIFHFNPKNVLFAAVKKTAQKKLIFEIKLSFNNVFYPFFPFNCTWPPSNLFDSPSSHEREERESKSYRKIKKCVAKMKKKFQLNNERYKEIKLNLVTERWEGA